MDETVLAAKFTHVPIILMSEKEGPVKGRFHLAKTKPCLSDTCEEAF